MQLPASLVALVTIASVATAHPAGWNNVYCQSYTFDRTTLITKHDSTLTEQVCADMKAAKHSVKVTTLANKSYCQSSSFWPWRHIDSDSYNDLTVNALEEIEQEMLTDAEHAAAITGVYSACWWEEQTQVITAHPDMMQVSMYIPPDTVVYRHKEIFYRDGRKVETVVRLGSP